MKDIKTKPQWKYYVGSAIIYALPIEIMYQTAVYISPEVKEVYFTQIGLTYIDVPFLVNSSIAFLFVGFLFSGWMDRMLHEYTISKRYIRVKKGILKNEVTIPVNGRLIVTIKQSPIDYILRLGNIELEADGDSSSPEGVMEHVDTKYFDYITSSMNSEGTVSYF